MRLASEAGRCLKSVVDEHPLLSKKNFQFAADLPWLFTVFDFAFSGVSGSSIEAIKATWKVNPKGIPTLVYEPTLLKMRKSIPARAAEFPDISHQWRATIEDVLSASVEAIDILLADDGDPAPKTAQEDSEIKLNADGPLPPKSFVFQGKQIDTIEPKPWAVLDMLWKSRRAKVSAVECEVWGEESDSDDRLKAAMKKANRALDQVGCTLVVRKSGGWLTLE